MEGRAPWVGFVAGGAACISHLGLRLSSCQLLLPFCTLLWPLMSSEALNAGMQRGCRGGGGGVTFPWILPGVLGKQTRLLSRGSCRRKPDWKALYVVSGRH